MPDLLQLEVATPEKLLVSEQVTEVQIPAKSGFLGILPGHAALLSELGEGLLTYTVAGRKRSLTLAGGFVEVLENHVRVVADRATEAPEPRP
jgi:F-type H+-transporting ATPase subunit epsilon